MINSIILSQNPVLLLIVAALIIGMALGAVFCYIALRQWLRYRIQKEHEHILRTRMLDAEKRIKHDTLRKSRAVLKGKIGEQLAPLLPDFRYNPADARFIGSPIDYIIFDGYSEAHEGQGNIRKIVFMDVKTGNAKLSPIQKKVEEAVMYGAVEWETLVLDPRIN